MSLKQKLQEDMKTAMRNKEKEKLTLIRLVQAAIKNEEIKIKGELEDDQVLTVISKTLKEAQESLKLYKEVGTNQAEIVKHELWVELLTAYLPSQLSEDEVRDMIKAIVTENGYSGKKDMRYVMPLIMEQTKNRFDGSKVNKLVGEILG